jgi:hypothetical protein
LSLFITAVGFVADNDFADSLWLAFIDFFEPVFDIFEGFSVGD